jgi:protein SSD1
VKQKILKLKKTLVLEENNISYDDTFSEEVNNCVPDENYIISEEERSKRRDLRSLRIISIDPETARDLDDAFSIKILKKWKL